MLLKTFLIRFVFLCVAPIVAVQAQVLGKTPAQLKYSTDFILHQVLFKKNIVFRSDIPKPEFFYESSTSLMQFQDAIEKQWGFRPAVFTNAYAFEKNQVYMTDGRDYYDHVNRCMDDSVAHELTHYVQAQYQHFDLNDESLEWDAVDVQTWFRENFCKL